MPAMEMEHLIDPREDILSRIGTAEEIELFNNQALVAVYMRPKNAKTKGGILLPEQHTDEDRYQSKVGLLIKRGPTAFVSDDRWTFQSFTDREDWLVFRPSDSWSITVNGVLCRIVDDINVRGRVSHPDKVW